MNRHESNRGISMFRGTLFTRSIATVVILAFSGLVTTPAVAAARNELERQQPQAMERDDTARMNNALIEVKARLRQVAGRPDHTGAPDVAERQAARSALQALRAELRELDRSVRQEFRDIERHLQAKDLPEVILQRHYDAVRKYEAEADALLDDLAAIETGDEVNAVKRAAQAFERLDRQQLQREHQPFDPEQLPNRVLGPEDHREPRLAPEDFIAIEMASFDYGRLLAAADGFDISGLTGADDPAYLLANDEVVLSDTIRAKAQALGHDPVAIHNWVRNNVHWQPSWGAVQDAELTLSAQRGNAFDIASLEIALLRASGIPARYVHGTIEVPANAFRNWAGGFEHLNAALEFVASGGVPVTPVTSNGVVTKVRVEHVWVEAAIDYFPSRGAVNRAADAWVAMDPSFKQYEVLAGLDLAAVTGLDLEAETTDLINSGTVDATAGWATGFDSSVQQVQAEAEAAIQSYINNNLPNATIGDVLGGRRIIAHAPSILSGALENRVLVAGNRYATLPQGLAQYIAFGFADAYGGVRQSARLRWSALNNEQVVLAFRPATQADEDALRSLLPEGEDFSLSELPSSIPSYLVQLVPELKVGGEVVMTGSAMNPGEELTFLFTPEFADRHSAPNRYSVIAGSYLAIAVVGGNVSPQALADSRNRIAATTALLESGDAAQMEAIDRDDIYGDLFHAGVLGYYSQLTARSYAAGLALGGHHYLAAGLGSYGYEPEVDYFFGMPRAIRPGGAVMNIPIVNVYGYDGDGGEQAREARLNYILQVGAMSSALEHAIPEQMFNSAQNPTEGISAMKALQKASAAGQRIYRIDSTNQSTVLPLLNHSSLVMNEIRNALYAGKVVVTHTDAVSVPGWSGAGYIIYDPVSGNGAYKIAGGQNGGFAALLTGVAQGAAAMAMLVAIFTAFAGGIMAGFAAIILIVFFILPFFLLAIEYANQVFDSEREQKCLGIGRSIGTLLVSLIGGIASKQLRTVLELIAGAIFIDGMLSGDFNGVGDCI